MKHVVFRVLHKKDQPAQVVCEPNGKPMTFSTQRSAETVAAKWTRQGGPTPGTFVGGESYHAGWLGEYERVAERPAFMPLHIVRNLERLR